MNEPIRSFEQLRVYKQGFEAAMRIFRLSKGFPKEELYSMTDQIRKSSRAVTANISEGWTKRRYAASFIAKFVDAEAEAAETINWLSYCQACEYIDSGTHQELVRTYDQIIGGLVLMAASPEKWCKPKLTIREHRAAYDE